MNQPVYRWPAWGRILPDALAFAMGLSVAWIQGWKTTDLVWSLWLSSLVVGYLTILSTIGGGVYMGVRVISHHEFPKKHRLTAILIGGGIALLFLGFFSLHFCAFHAGHAVFLSHFFPIEGLPDNAFMDAFMNPLLLWKTVFHHLLWVYGAFLLPVLIAERRYVFASLIASVKEVGEGMGKHTAQDVVKLAGKGSGRSLQDPFTRPYINVIRMHILIFFFAFCHLLKLESFLVYAVVYLVYFFPWKAFQTEAEEAQTDTTCSSLANSVPD
jgi:hypothetical protein